MRTKIYASLTVFALLVSGCDYVEQPYIGGPPDPSACPAPTFPQNTNQVRHVLLEEFTGHKCPNCPGGTYEIRTVLEPMYGDSLISVAVHAGSFADVETGTGQYYTDFSTASGDDYYLWANVSAWPIGMVNRTDNAGSGVLYYRPEWANAIAAELAKPLEINLQMIVDFDSATNKGCAHIESEFLTSLTGDFNMIVYVAEDSIVDWQLNGGAPNNDPSYPVGDNANYVHRHVLRDVPSGTWGKPVASGTIAPGTKYVNSISFTINPSWNKDHVSLIAYIYDFNATYRTIYQVAEKHLIE